METLVKVGGKWYGVFPISRLDLLKLYSQQQPIYFISRLFRKPIYHLFQKRNGEYDYFIRSPGEYMLTSRCGGLTERLVSFNFQPIVFTTPPTGFFPCARCFPDAIIAYRKTFLDLLNRYKETQRPKAVARAVMEWSKDFEERALFSPEELTRPY